MSRARPGARNLLLRVVLPALGLLVLVGFAFVMLFVGFADLRLDCERESPRQLPNCRIRESRLFGLYQRDETVTAVRGAGYSTQDVELLSRVTLASTVVLYGAAGPIELTPLVSNSGDAWKVDVITRVRGFTANHELPRLAIRIEDRSVFGWIGLGLAALMGLSTLASALGWRARRR